MYICLGRAHFRRTLQRFLYTNRFYAVYDICIRIHSAPNDETSRRRVQATSAFIRSTESVATKINRRPTKTQTVL